MIEKDVISQLVEEKLASSGNYLVDVVIKPGNLIIIEIDNDEGVCIDDCAELSRYVEGHLDRDVEDFELEVGSAGIDVYKRQEEYLSFVAPFRLPCRLSGAFLYGRRRTRDYQDASAAVEFERNVRGGQQLRDRKQGI